MRFSGKVGYGVTVETSPSVYKDQIHERTHFGDVIRNSLKSGAGESVNNDLSVNNSISIVADAYANEHFFAIRYVIWAGAYWEVSNVELQRPRLILMLGGIYNGPKP